MAEVKTETCYLVTRCFKWWDGEQRREHRDYLVGIRTIRSPHPEVSWAPDIAGASTWDTEDVAKKMAKLTRDTEAKVERRSVTVDVETIAV